MSGLANKSLPFSSDGYFVIASNLELPVIVCKSDAGYLLHQNFTDLALGSLDEAYAFKGNVITQLKLRDFLGLDASIEGNVVDISPISTQIRNTGTLGLNATLDSNTINFDYYVIHLRRKAPLEIASDISVNVVANQNAAEYFKLDTLSLRLGPNPLTF